MAAQRPMFREAVKAADRKAGVRSQSDPERSLGKQIHEAGLGVFASEYEFAAHATPPRKWRFDICFMYARLAVEIEGGTWLTGAKAGAHGRGKHFASDAEKYAEAMCLGWRVLRVTTDMVDDGRALAYIVRLLAA